MIKKIINLFSTIKNINIYYNIKFKIKILKKKKINIK